MANTNNLSFGLKLDDGQVLVLGGSQFVSNKSGQFNLNVLAVDHGISGEEEGD